MKYHYKQNVKWAWVIYSILTNKRFRWMLKLTIQYALRNFHEKRGDGSSDVLLFEKYFAHKLFKEDNP